MRKWLSLMVLAVPVLGLLWLVSPLSPISPAYGAPGPHGGYQPTEDTCAACHGTHTAKGEGLLATVETGNAFCYTCHDGTGAPATPVVSTHSNVDFGSSAEETFELACVSCHEPHGSSNLYAIRAYVRPDSASPSTVGPVIFTATSGAFSYDDGTSAADSRLCFGCHASGLNQNSPMANHNGGAGHSGGADYSAQDCIGCHPHSADGERGTLDGFMPAGGSCTDCHANPQGPRRAVTPDFGRSSHHVQGSVTDTDCVVCHEMTQHQQGVVRLSDPDDPGTLLLALTNHPDTDPATANALEGFCLACHDADGAAGSAPFSDGLTPPVIDQTLWAAASHETSAAVGTCWECHNQGHGSNKQFLLAPWDAINDGPTDDPWRQEEQFCFECHDSDGPATADLATLFGQPINWVDQATGLNSNPNLNDRHDVQLSAQTVTGAVIECVNCHNPHEATSARPYILDPDPNDGRVPGTGAVFAGTDEWSEFCMDCHDGTYGPGVVGHTSPAIIDIRTTWLDDGMGAKDSSGGVGLMPGTGWEAESAAQGNITMECWRCHSPHPVIDSDTGNTNHFGIVDRAMDYDGVTPLEGWWDRISGSWQLSILYDVSVNDTTNDNQLNDGGTFCNTCHDRTSMVKKDDCWACHRHGDGSRW